LRPLDNRTNARQSLAKSWRWYIKNELRVQSLSDFFLGGGQLWLRGVHMPLASTGKSACSRARPEQMRIDMENVVPA
jgi:hypothetical protein